MPNQVPIKFSLITMCVGLGALAPDLVAESNWPAFRGADGSGRSRDADAPVRWTEQDVVWRTPLDGAGHSSPCIWEDRLFLTTAASTASGRIERAVLCLDRGDGGVVWRRIASVGEAEKLHKMNSYATATCATDGERVVAFFGRGGLHCFDLAGRPLWSRDLGEFPGPWGTGGSPIIFNETVIQNCDAEGEAFLMAFDIKTGKTVWQTKRETLPRGGWSTPFLFDAGSRRELILNGESGVRGYEPHTGKELWFCRSFNGRGTPVPARDQQRLYVISGKSGDVYAVRPGGTGDVTASRMDWHTPRGGGRDLSSPICVDGFLFVVNMSGIGTCYHASDGKEVWKARLNGNFSASPIVLRGLIYIQNEAGETLVIEPGEQLKVVARNSLGNEDEEIFRSTLAPSDGQLFFRSTGAAYCVGVR